MHKVWILISSLAIVVLIGGTAYFVQLPVNPGTPMTAAPQMPADDQTRRVAPGANPLLTANPQQFRMWVPLYPIPCGEIVFEKADQKDREFSICVDEIRRRVPTVTGYPLDRVDVLDARVKAHWHNVMGDL